MAWAWKRTKMKLLCTWSKALNSNVIPLILPSLHDSLGCGWGSERPFEGLYKMSKGWSAMWKHGVWRCIDFQTSCLEWVNGLNFRKSEIKKGSELHFRKYDNRVASVFRRIFMDLKGKAANDTRPGEFHTNPASGKNPFCEFYWNTSIIQSQKSHIWPHTKIHSRMLNQLGGVMRTDTWKNVGGLNKGGTGENTRRRPHALSRARLILIDRITGNARCQERSKNLSGNTFCC